MATASFETPEGDEVEIDGDEVVAIRPGDEPETVAIEMEDGSEVVVVASALEVAADLGLDPSEVVDDEFDDPSDDEEEDG